MNEICIIFQKIEHYDLIRYMENTSILDFLHKNLSCREFLIFKITNDLNVDSKELIDMDMKNLIQTFKFTTIQKWLKNSFDIHKTLDEVVNFQDLWLYNNNIIDISPLKSLVNLQKLNLCKNKIGDISSLKSLKNLQFLWLSNNKISDVSSLQSLENLQHLFLNDNEIVDISPLQSLVNLRCLDLDNNNIVDVSPLQKLTNLLYLYLRNNNIVDVSPLKDLNIKYDALSNGLPIHLPF